MSVDGGERYFDSCFARFLGERSALTGPARDCFEGLVRQLSEAMAAGHSCLPVTQADAVILRASPLVSDGRIPAPLVLCGDRLYLHRYHRYESRLAEQLARLAAIEHDIGLMQPDIVACFGPDRGEVDWQRRAAEVSLARSLAIISGGPGTGKTTTVVRIIGLLIQMLGKGVRIALAAPTGKAAMRLTESIGESLAGLAFPAEVLATIPTSASTLHRLLGVRRHRPDFRCDHDNPLPCDVVVVDEASMVDLALMSKLVDALGGGTRLILLGDKDQLASVESGAVLADCIRSLPDNTVELRKSFRFDRSIKTLAQAVNRGDGNAAWQLLAGSDHGNVGLLPRYLEVVGPGYCAYMEVVKRHQQEGMAAVFRKFSQFRVLCAIRRGGRGVLAVNAQVERFLKLKGYDTSTDPWYLGRPVMVTANDYSLELFNGDVGICLPDPGDGTMKVWFERSDGELMGCLPYRLPPCETVFAMTVHKSQGSEFAAVVVILPAEENPLLNRQLVYTAVTRAKESVQIVASKSILVYALQSDYPRSSGLADRLRNAVPTPGSMGSL
ncbi:MAG: exodeoxyribonuclease V subunit alpha [Desulfopila sp.]